MFLNNANYTNNKNFDNKYIRNNNNIKDKASNKKFKIEKNLKKRFRSF